MLSELEHTFTELQKQRQDSTPSLCQLPPHWSDRLEMTQNSFRAKEPILALRRALLSLGSGYELQLPICSLFTMSSLLLVPQSGLEAANEAWVSICVLQAHV